MSRISDLGDEIDYIEGLEIEDTSSDPVDFWTRKQRELITATVDYNLSTLSSLIDEQQIALSPKYQRRNRWDPKRQSRLVESFLMNVPVPPIFLNEDDIGIYSVIDGKQRLNTIYRFLTNSIRLEGLSVFSDINGLTFFELPKPLQTILRTRPTIRSIIILKQSDPDVKHEVFQRLNTGGAHLNPQEIRNNAFSGPLNDLIMSITEDRMFQKALNIRNKDKSAIYKEMRDAEFVLRFFTFHKDWENFAGGVRRAMDTYMEKHRRLPPPALDVLRDSFQQALEKALIVFWRACLRTLATGKNGLAQASTSLPFRCSNVLVPRYRQARCRTQQRQDPSQIPDTFRRPTL